MNPRLEWIIISPFHSGPTAIVFKNVRSVAPVVILNAVITPVVVPNAVLAPVVIQNLSAVVILNAVKDPCISSLLVF
jgi:hypothetical protein